ncbi:NAD binding domain of 6-phosphogluconate dehydrogenase-domain-containing protein [Aspergillus pseudoustus]|uniref:NAD binding domain of 6-phosphogluconate dehydrogenase-domain-containing protein n=1 Tax=Aspergillus pseudoustus TaxID=1810923 RepID=A0ABR4JCV9_9EURO
MENPAYTSVGFIGLGAMGKPMAEQLAIKLPTNVPLIVYDIVASAVTDLVERYPGKVLAGKSPLDVTAKSQVIFSMVPEGAHVKSVYLDETSGVCCRPLNNRMLVDCSTIDLATSLAVKDQITRHHPQASFYDAPVSGGVIGAEKGTIAFFLGCSEDDPNLAQLAQLLNLMGKEFIPCGAPSLGLCAKLSNNYLSGLIAIAASESLIMGMRGGLDPRVLSRVFAAGTGQNTIIDRFNPCPGVAPEAPSTRGYKGGFKVQLMKKDFSLAVAMAAQQGTRLALGSAGLQLYGEAAEDPRCRDLDSRVVFRLLGGDENWKERFEANND